MNTENQFVVTDITTALNAKGFLVKRADVLSWVEGSGEGNIDLVDEIVKKLISKHVYDMCYACGKLTQALEFVLGIGPEPKIVNVCDVYVQNGYTSREHYLRSLAEENGVDEEVVIVLASTYGPSEDFDGLVTAVEDIADDMF